MSSDVGLGAGEATAGVVEAELAHIDERIEPELLGGDVLRRNERGALDHAFAQGGQARGRAAHGDHGEVAIGNEAALSEYEANDAVFLRADGRDAECFALEVGDGFDVRRREKAPIERVDAASEINRVGAADGGGDERRAAEKAIGTWPETIAVVKIGLP